MKHKIHFEHGYNVYETELRMNKWVCPVGGCRRLSVVDEEKPLGRLKMHLSVYHALPVEPFEAKQPCKLCRKLFSASHWSREQFFCSDKCSQDWNKIKKSQEKIIKCEWCGKFSVVEKPYLAKRQRYCSIICSNRANHD